MTTEPVAPAPTVDSPRPRWQRKAWKDMSARERAIGCGGAIALLFLCSICSQLVGDDDDEGTDAPAAAVATRTARPTDDPAVAQGTRTAAAEQRATKAAEAEETEAARPTEDPEAEAVREYVGWVVETVTGLQDAMSSFGEQMGRVSESPALLFDDSWKVKVAASLAAFSLAADQIKARDDVPGPAKDLHAQALELADRLESIRVNLAEGIDELDMEKIAVAATASNDMPGIIEEMTVLGAALTAIYGAP